MNLIGRNVGNYRVTAKVGEGGMGAVFLGEHPMIGKRVAIKMLHAELASKEEIVARFFTEARAVNDIGHPNIVDIVDFGKIYDEDQRADVVYFIMEYLDGEGLNQRLKREEMPERDAVHILRQCASALAASHKKNVVHRDIKPDNIYLITRGDDRSYVKLLDFGIAKLTGAEGERSQNKTRTGLVIGTPAYMSPEQCEGKGQIDWRSDIYSLGVVFFEMITGRVPFVGEGFGEILVAHITQQPVLPSSIRPHVSSGLEAIAMRMLEKDRSRRFASMEELIVALDDPAAHLEVYGSPSGRVEVAPTRVLDAVDAEGRPLRYSGQGPRSITGEGARPTTGQGARPITGQGARPTTLSGSTGEMASGTEDHGRPASKFKVPALVGAALATIAAGGLYAMFKTPNHSATATIEAAAVPRPREVEPVEEFVDVKVESRPAGASIIRSGGSAPLGVTPYAFRLKKNEPGFDVLLKLEGYEPQTQAVETNGTRTITVTLARSALPPPPPQRTTATAAVREIPPAAVKPERKKRDKGYDNDSVMDPFK